MKFEKECILGGVLIPPAAMRLSNFGDHEGAEYHTLKNCVVVLKKSMNALELIRAAWALQNLSAKLCARLVDRCSECDGKCGSCDGDCPYCDADFALDVKLPDEVREVAGISEDAVLHVEYPGKGQILLCENDDEPGLWDVPAPMMACLLSAGICPAALEELLESGEAV